MPTYHYDAFNRMDSAGGMTYYINPEGQRLRKSGAAGTTYFAPGPGGALLAEDTNGAWVDYVWLNGRLIGRIANGQTYAVHVDQTGRPEAVTDASRTVVWQAQNLAFTRNVTAASITLNIGFPGQYYDAETGKWNNGYRDYDARLGRYVESDPIGLSGGVNTYAYVGNDPLSNSDPFGLRLCKTALPGLGDTYMDSTLYPMVQKWMNANAASGIGVNFTSAFRTTDHQAGLGVGAITPAKPGHSLHEAGFAVDISWSSLSAANQTAVLQNARSSGLSWGGNFRSPDPVHFYDDPGNRSQYIQSAQRYYQHGSASDCKCGS